MDVHRSSPVATEIGSIQSQYSDSPRTNARTPYRTRISASRASNPSAAKRPPRMPAVSWSQAARYIVCIRRVNETPEKSRSRALEMLMPLMAPAGVANSSCTASAESPVSVELPDDRVGRGVRPGRRAPGWTPR